MNRNTLLTLITITLIASSALAAKAPVQKDFNPEVAQCEGSRVDLPDGTRFLRSQGKAVSLKMPSTHFVAKVNGGFATGLKLTCTCTKGSGCNPTAAGGSVGCTLTASCSACTGSKTGVIMEDTGIGFETMSGVGTAMRYDNDMTQLEWLNDELDAFIYGIYGMGQMPEPRIAKNGSLVAPEGYKWAALRVYGHQASILVPEAQISGSMVAASSVSCSCSSGSGGCVKKSDWRGVTWCEAGSCNSCTMDTGASFDGGVSTPEMLSE